MSRLPAFQPGQLNALANQLNTGFGGGLRAWKGDLRNTFDPTPMRSFDFGGGHHNNGGGGNQHGGNNAGGGNGGGNHPTDGGAGGFDPSSPRNRMAPMAMPMMGQRPMQMQMQMQPQQGLLNAQMPQNRGLLGDIPPEVLAFLSSGVRR